MLLKGSYINIPKNMRYAIFLTPSCAKDRHLVHLINVHNTLRLAEKCLATLVGIKLKELPDFEYHDYTVPSREDFLSLTDEEWNAQKADLGFDYPADLLHFENEESTAWIYRFDGLNHEDFVKDYFDASITCGCAPPFFIIIGIRNDKDIKNRMHAIHALLV